MSATIEFIKNQQREIVYFTHGNALADVQTLAFQLLEYSNCMAEFCTCTQRGQLAGTSESSGDFADIGLFAKILMRNATDGKLYAVMIPAPKISMFDPVAGQGFKVKESVGIQITQYYAAMSGEPMTYHDGWLVGNTL